jgi:L-malate glycosyltransferase
MMKKLLIIGSNTIHTFNFIELIRDEFEQIFLVTDNDNAGLKYNVEGIHRICFSLRNPIRFFRGIKKLRWLIEDYNPDIIHSLQITTNSLQVLLANRKTGKPAVYTALGSDVLYTPESGMLYSMMVKYILRQGRYFTADAHYMADIMDSLAGEKKDTLVANFGALINENLNTDKQNIIYSNRQLKSLYRIDKIVQAFARFLMSSGDKSWKLIVAADGDRRKELTGMIGQLGISQQVEFTGWLTKEENDMNYAKARFYVSVPESDGTSISLLEAMGYGCIPILSDLPSNREWVENGVNGMIVANLDSDFISEALKIDTNRAIAQNKNIIDARGTKDVNRRKFIQFYEKMLAGAN